MEERQNQIAEVIAKSAEAAFSKIIEENPEHEFYAFALTTNSDADYVNGSVNSHQNREKIIKDAGENGDKYKDYYTWFPGVWKDFEFVYPDLFNPVNDILRKYHNELLDDGFIEYRDDVFESMIKALKILNDKGFWGQDEKRSSVTVFMTIYDCYLTEEYEEKSARLLNPKETFEEFNNRKL